MNRSNAGARSPLRATGVLSLSGMFIARPGRSMSKWHQRVQLPCRLTSPPASRTAGSEDGAIAANQGSHLEELPYQSGLGWDPYPVRGDCMTWFGSGG